MDLEAAKLVNGRICRYAMVAALSCLLLTAAILLAASLHEPGETLNVVQLPPPFLHSLPAS